MRRHIQPLGCCSGISSCLTPLPSLLAFRDESVLYHWHVTTACLLSWLLSSSVVGFHEQQGTWHTIQIGEQNPCQITASVWNISKEAFAALAVKMIMSQDFSGPRFLWSRFLDTVLWRLKKNACKESAWKYSSQPHKNPHSLSAATFWLCKMTHRIVCLNLQPASMLLIHRRVFICPGALPGVE